MKVYSSEPMHTAEHILNQTMIRLFGCSRSTNAHVERKKSKCDYWLSRPPTEAEVTLLEDRVNAVISSRLPVTERCVSLAEAADLVDLSKLPEGAGETIRLIAVGDYDLCACSGPHVENTAEIGRFSVLSHDYEDGRWRVRWKVATT